MSDCVFDAFLLIIDVRGNRGQKGTEKIDQLLSSTCLFSALFPFFAFQTRPGMGLIGKRANERVKRVNATQDQHLPIKDDQLIIIQEKRWRTCR